MELGTAARRTDGSSPQVPARNRPEIAGFDRRRPECQPFVRVLRVLRVSIPTYLSRGARASTSC